jgi:hypothetical protein
MNPIATVLTTAAVTAASIKAYGFVRKKLKQADPATKWLKKRRSKREDGVVVDLEPDEATGVFAMKQAK